MTKATMPTRRAQDVRYVHHAGSDALHPHYPSVATRGEDVYVAWIAFQPAAGTETLRLSRVNGGDFVDVTTVVGACPSLLPPVVATDGRGAVWTFWIQAPDFSVWGACFDPEAGILNAKRRLSKVGARCNQLVATPAGDGLWVAWESWDPGVRCHVVARNLRPTGRWSQQIDLTTGERPAYWPSLAMHENELWAAWSSPNDVSDGYDVYVARSDGSNFGAACQPFRLNVEREGNFHLYPRLERIASTLWIAWMASTDTEYYDDLPIPGNSDFAYLQDAASRRKRNAWWKTFLPGVARLSASGAGIEAQSAPGSGDWLVRSAGHCHYPALAPGRGAVPTILVRKLTSAYLYTTLRIEHDGKSWREPQPLHDETFQTGRNGPISVTHGDGIVAVASQGHPVVAGELFRWQPAPSGGMSVQVWPRLDDQNHAEGRGRAPCVLQGVPLPKAPPRWQSRRSIHGTYTFFGNTHVHSDLSGCRRDTQQSIDFNYRWARDLMNQDFNVITDHAEHLTLYDWKWTRTMADFFDFPGSYISILGYEWTTNRPDTTEPHDGHCNVLFSSDAVRACGSTHAETATLEKLWAFLPKGGALTIPHHTACFPFQRDWNRHDSAFERLVEVHQDRRGNFEYPGCPAAPGVGVPQQGRETLIDGCFVSDALGKGMRLGLCSGGDHMGISMAGVQAPRLTRSSIYDALYDRRCYGVTGAAIQLDLQVHVDGQPAGSMGTELVVPPGRTLVIHVRVDSTAPLQRIELISSGAVQATRECDDGMSDEVSFSIAGAHGGEARYFYVRVTQQDGEIAWSSPVWVQGGINNP